MWIIQWKNEREVRANPWFGRYLRGDGHDCDPDGNGNAGWTRHKRYAKQFKTRREANEAIAECAVGPSTKNVHAIAVRV
jgi:hypothetical protein